jgi:SAM-dependent methyltransferase
MKISFVCPKCHYSLSYLSSKTEKCSNCDLALEMNKTGGINYSIHKLLFENRKRKYLLSKVVNNNGMVSYVELPEGSLSLPNRPDVARFRHFVYQRLKSCYGLLLDVGCGPLPMAGYIDDRLKKKWKIFGLDPGKSNNYEGCYIRGCSEFTPFSDQFIDVAIFATSIDHVVDLDLTFKELYRIMKEHGKVLIWMGDRSKIEPFTIRSWEKIKWWIRLFLKPEKWREGWENWVFRHYWVYDNGSVFYIPPGGIDPFHTFKETPDLIKKGLTKAGFSFVEGEYNHKNEVFLYFQKLTT